MSGVLNSLPAAAPKCIHSRRTVSQSTHQGRTVLEHYEFQLRIPGHRHRVPDGPHPRYQARTLNAPCSFHGHGYGGNHRGFWVEAGGGLGEPGTGARFSGGRGGSGFPQQPQTQNPFSHFERSAAGVILTSASRSGGEVRITEAERSDPFFLVERALCRDRRVQPPGRRPPYCTATMRPSARVSRLQVPQGLIERIGIGAAAGGLYQV